MLDLNRSVGSSTHGIWRDPWKILVYDSYCRDVISPLLKVGDLRKCGITLHLLLDSERECVSDVPALYFLRPTRANVCRLGDDCAKALYQSFDMNFTPGIPRLLLEELASRSLECGAQMRRISDQHLNFASLEDGFFSLLLPRATPQHVEAIFCAFRVAFELVPVTHRPIYSSTAPIRPSKQSLR